MRGILADSWAVSRVLPRGRTKAKRSEEVIDSGDHSSDTVTKKMIYEECRLPRLWMVDLRYDNVEVYHGTQYGVTLKTILAQHEFLTEKLLPALNLSISELFAD